MKKPRPDEERLSRAAADPRAHLDDIREALRSRRSHPCARAAQLVKKHALDGFEADLAAAFERFCENPVKADPSCGAKLACLEALDFGESANEKIFVRAARLVQLEPAWGPPVDTATSVRARGLLALARLGWDDLDLLVAESLTDEHPPVRQAALDALAHRGARAGASLALYKLRRGDEDPLVTLAAMAALLTLAPEWGVEELRARLAGDECELAAIALGQSRADGALPLLLSALEECVEPARRKHLFRGLGLHRSDRALEKLLQVIAESPLGDAREAVLALAVRRYDPGIVERVRRAAARPALRSVVDEHFSAPAP
jgi:hypothetical protein